MLDRWDLREGMLLVCGWVHGAEGLSLGALLVRLGGKKGVGDHGSWVTQAHRRAASRRIVPRAIGHHHDSDECPSWGWS